MHKKKLFPVSKIKQTEKYIFKKHHLSLVYPFVTSRFFRTMRCVNENGEHFLVKIRAEKSSSTNKKFLKEIYLNKYLHKNQNNNSQLVFSEYFASNVENSPEWLIYRFREGKQVGWWYNFYDKQLNKVYSFLPKIIISLSKFKIDQSKFDKNKYQEAVEQYNKYTRLMRKFFKASEIEQGRRILANHKKELGSPKLALTHGDLNPTNIILTDRGKINIIDWFDAHLNNRAYDAAFLWLILWNHPSKQKLFLKTLLKNVTNKKEFATLFKLDLIILTPKMLDVVNDVLVHYQNKKKRGKKLTKTNIKEIAFLKRAHKYFISHFHKIINE